MIGRVFAASLTVALVFGPVQTFAKSGGLSGGFSIKSGGLSAKSSGLFSARHGHSFRARIPVRSVFLPPVVPPFGVGNASASPTRLLQPVAPSYRRVFGYRLPAAGIGVYYGAGAIGPVFPVVTSSSPDVRYAEFARRCTETKIVPSEEGGERSITIRRC
jgi:hypothetical protein